jgi:hypothetical protein
MALAIASAIIALAAACIPACKGAKCGSDDLECLLDNLVVVPPENDAKPQRLVAIPSERLKPTRAVTEDAGTQAGACPVGKALCQGECIDAESETCRECPPGDAWCPGTGCTFTGGDEKNCGGCGRVCDPRQICDTGICQCRGDQPNCMSGDPPGGPPSITNAPPKLEFDEPQTLEPFDLAFDDPNGCQPAFCAHLCKGPKCSRRFLCTRPVNDHRFQGVFRSYLGFLAEPAADANLTLGVAPLSTRGCPENMLEQVADGTLTVDVGAEIEVKVTIDAPFSSTSSSSGGSSSGSVGGPSGAGTYCSPAVATCNCSVTACSNGSSCWYQTSRGRVNCTSCGAGCQRAAQTIVSSCCPRP